MLGPCYLQQFFSLFEVLHEALRVEEIAHPFVEMVLLVMHIAKRKLVRRVTLEEKVRESAFIKAFSRCVVIDFAIIRESHVNTVLYFCNVPYKTRDGGVTRCFDAMSIKEIK